MKDFMMIFLGADYVENGLSPEQMQERMGKWFAWNTKMQEQGVVKSGDALHSAGKRISGENRTVTDGPFVESKELIGGYYIITVADEAAAIEVAQDFPDYDLGGTVEIREVMKFEN
jgi:hypothetical protein